MKVQKAQLRKYPSLFYFLRNKQAEGSIWRKLPVFLGKGLRNATGRTLYFSTHSAPFCCTATLETTSTTPLEGAFSRDTGVINSSLQLIKQGYHCLGKCWCGPGTCWLWRDRILNPFRDVPHTTTPTSQFPLATVAHSNPLNLQLTMRATLIWNNKWTPVIHSWSSFWGCESNRERGIRSDVPTIKCLRTSGAGATERHVITRALSTLVWHARHVVATSWRKRSGKAQTRRVNVNVLTRLPKIRAAPATVSPLNSTPVYPTRQAQSFVHLRAVGCWGFDAGEGSNGIKGSMLCPLVCPLFPSYAPANVW